MNSLTVQVRDYAKSMNEKSKTVGSYMDTLRELSIQLKQGMTEIFSGAQHIGEAVERVQDLSRDNRESIDRVAEKISVFKLKE